MDEDGDGILSKRGLWRYFRTFLSTLLTISGPSLDMTTEELNAICDDCAVWTSSQLLLSLAKERGDVRGCTFEDLADWYTQGGYMIATWLELLDLSKWLPLRPLEETSPRPQTAPSSQRQDPVSTPVRYNEPPQHQPENPFVEHDGAEIFRCSLSQGHVLSLRASDINFVLEVVQLLKRRRMTPPALVKLMKKHAHGSDTITISSYNKFVGDIVLDELVGVC